MIKWGLTSNGKQRFRCRFCKISNIRKRPDQRKRRTEVLFERWLLETETLGRLAHRKNTTASSFLKRFNQFWDIKIEPIKYINNDHTLLVDGIILERNSCVLIAIDGDGIPVTWYSCMRENSTNWDVLFELVKKQGFSPSVIVSDGQKGLIKSIHWSFGHISHQRCMTHVVRLSQAWLTRNPQTMAGVELRAIAGDLYKVITRDDRDKWNLKFKDWNEKHLKFLKERSVSLETKRWWYTHRRLRAVRSLILGALPELFTFIDIANTPRTTNRLEGGVNSPIKALLRHHRGMKNLHKKVLVFRFLRARQYRNTNTKG